MAVTAALGQWQLSRADQKEALHLRAEQRRNLPALTAAGLLAIADPPAQLDRKVRLRGRWADAHTVLLENRQMNGLPGFYVVTPLTLEGAERSVLVQRGWIQRNFEQRDRVDLAAAPAGIVEVVGHLAPPPARLHAFTAVEQGRIRQNLDLQAFAAETRLPLATDVSVVQTEGGVDGLRRDWPLPLSGVEKHYGYAFQWFGLCATIAGLFVWFQLIAPRRALARRTKT